MRPGRSYLLAAAFALAVLGIALAGAIIPLTTGSAAAPHFGLVCFSILSPKAAAILSADRQAEAQRGWMKQASCDDMCAARSASCITTEGFGGLDACAAVRPEAEISACRCCATEK